MRLLVQCCVGASPSQWCDDRSGPPSSRRTCRIAPSHAATGSRDGLGDVVRRTRRTLFVDRHDPPRGNTGSGPSGPFGSARLRDHAWRRSSPQRREELMPLRPRGAEGHGRSAPQQRLQGPPGASVQLAEVPVDGLQVVPLGTVTSYRSFVVLVRVHSLQDTLGGACPG